MFQTIILWVDMNVQSCTKFCSLKKPDFSYIKLLKSGSNSKKKVMIKILERSFQNHFIHSFGSFKHVSEQSWIHEQIDSDVDQCAVNQTNHVFSWQKRQFLLLSKVITFELDMEPFWQLDIKIKALLLCWKFLWDNFAKRSTN